MKRSKLSPYSFWYYEGKHWGFTINLKSWALPFMITGGPCEWEIRMLCFGVSYLT